jgi:hypothetical protein
MALDTLVRFVFLVLCLALLIRFVNIATGVVVAGDSTGALFILRVADVMRKAEAQRLEALAVARANAAAALAREAEKQRELAAVEEVKAKQAAAEEAAKRSGGINAAIITFPNGNIAQTLAMPRALVRCSPLACRRLPLISCLICALPCSFRTAPKTPSWLPSFSRLRVWMWRRWTLIHALTRTRCDCLKTRDCIWLWLMVQVALRIEPPSARVASPVIASYPTLTTVVKAVVMVM